MPAGRLIKAVLWDADGVLQATPPDNWTAATAVVQEFPDHLTGARVDEQRITEVVDRLGMSERLEEILAVWSSFEVETATLEVVRAVRSSGTPCYLATNQDSYRASRMRLLTPYDEALDGAYYSCDLGVAKPSVAYFAHIAADLGLAPADLLFVDDLVENVAGARQAGLAAEQWHHGDGTGILRDQLASHGVSLGDLRAD